MKKLRLFILTIIMLFTVLPVNILAEGEDKTSLPDVTVFATKEQMMDGTFAPNDQGEPQKIGRITFGKTYSGLSNNIWYILGQDKGIKDDDGKLIDNTVIFSNYAIADDRLFNSKTNDKPNEVDYKYTKENANVYKDIDVDNDGIVSVYVNHYGASELHNDLTNMASNLTMFSETEQKLMNETTIKTMDIKNGFLYETKDKLYAMTSDYTGSQIIKLGSANQIKIKTLKYFEHSGLNFWLRSPIDNTGVLFAENFIKTTQTSADSTAPWKIFVLPASNLNLTNVLFASAAKAGSTSIIQRNEIMTLRLDGKAKNIGEIYYDEENKEIIVSRGSTENTVHLILQGKDTRNWYYSKEITGKEVIKASDIEEAIGLTPELILSNSKIWLEITDIDGMKYAVEAKKAIKKVEITDIEKPYVNGIPDTSATCTSTGVNTTTPLVSWKPENNPFGYYTEYTASVTLIADEGYGFVDEDKIEATVNGKTATSVKKNDDTLTVSYTFKPTARKLIISIDSLPSSITVENGTSYDDMGLPQIVKAYLKDDTTTDLNISWEPSDVYDPNKKESQIFTLTGSIEIPESLLYEDVNTVSIEVTVKAAKTEEVIPTPVPPSSAGSAGYVVPNTAVK